MTIWLWVERTRCLMDKSPISSKVSKSLAWVRGPIVIEIYLCFLWSNMQLGECTVWWKRNTRKGAYHVYKIFLIYVTIMYSSIHIVTFTLIVNVMDRSWSTQFLEVVPLATIVTHLTKCGAVLFLMVCPTIAALCLLTLRLLIPRLSCAVSIAGPCRLWSSTSSRTSVCSVVYNVCAGPSSSR